MSDRICTKCAAAGHLDCKAVEESNLCAFCEDEVPCPIAQRSPRSIAKTPAPTTPETTEAKMPTTPESRRGAFCACGARLRKDSTGDQCGKCRKLAAKTANEPGSPRPKTTRRRPAKPAERKIVFHIDAPERIPIYVTEQQLNDWWNRRPIAERANLFQNWVDGQ